VNYSTRGWFSGPADTWAIAVGYQSANQFANSLFLNGRDYRITLETRNLCGDTDFYALEFSTSSQCNGRPLGVGPISEEDIAVYPNPFWNGTTLNYKAIEATDVQIFIAGFNTSGTYQPPTLKGDASGYKEVGDHQVDFSNYEMSSGLNYIFIVTEDATYVRSITKH
jgi:hypothetical protein